jgi:CRISPR-associated protein Csm3
MTKVQLLGRVLIGGNIVAKTGLHIGGSPGALAIGNVDLPVIRDARTNEPYIPGSSLKGKMRSLSEKLSGAPQNKSIGRDVNIHVAETAAEYLQYWVNPLFGVPGEVKFDVNGPNRLIVRDIPLLGTSRDELLNARTDLPFTEVKWEAAIDRVTSAAVPRQIERVPAGAIFGPMELVLSVFLKEDVQLLGHLLTALQLVEDDYLGGQGSRGSGKVEFHSIFVQLRRGENYEVVPEPTKPFKDLALPALIERKVELLDWVKNNLPQS